MLLEKINKKFEERAYELGRKKFINDVIANIGKTVEYDDRIICYVKQELLDKNAKPNFYHLDLYGMNTHYEEFKKMVDYYKLDKPVFYLFDGITFDVPIILSSYFCTVTFTNCVFLHSYFNIYHADKLNFGDNKYYDVTSIVGGGAFLRTVSSAKIGELCFRNEHFINEYELKKYVENNFGIDITADKVDIVNSTIITDEKNGQINIKADKVKIQNSRVDSPEIYFDASVVDVDRKSKINASKGIIVGNDTNDADIDICIDDIASPYVVLNGIEWVNYEANNKAFYHDDPVKLQEKRKEVTMVLKNIKARCDEVTDEKVERVKNNIESQKIKKLLRK